MSDVELFWPASKDPLSHLLRELYQKVQLEDASRVAGFLYDLGHPNRGYLDFRKTVALRDLEDERIEGEILKTRISAPLLVDQLSAVMQEYEESLDDSFRNPLRADSLRALSERSQGVNVELILRNPSSQGYTIERYRIC